MQPWDDPQVACDLHKRWTTDPQNIADADRLAAIAKFFGLLVGRSLRMIDYGCGTGRMAERIASDCYLGYDLTSTMIQRARDLYPQHNFATSLAPTDVADVVVSNSVIQYVPEQQWRTELEEICMRAPLVMIETYDGAPRETRGGYNSQVWIRTPEAYESAIAALCGNVLRIQLSMSEDPALALYIAGQLPLDR